MKHIQSIALASSREELLPDFDAAFPYIATCAELDRYTGAFTPWHWHRAVELFYVKSGCLEYRTPNGKWFFPAGSGGFVNANVLHTSHAMQSGAPSVQLLHLFEPSLLSGTNDSRIAERYILPLTTSGVELLALHPEKAEERILLQRIRDAFALDEGAWGFEFRLREALSQIWLEVFALSRPMMDTNAGAARTETLKTLMIYVHEHFQQTLSVDELAKNAGISRRACFRLFQQSIHMTPLAYIHGCRMQLACELLRESRDSVTEIAYHCGFSSNSYFAKRFREELGCTPLEYREKWHDSDKNGRKSGGDITIRSL